MIRRSKPGDFEYIYSVINDAAQVYKDVLPRDCWKDPYMSRDELAHEIESGVEFWVYDGDGGDLGIMGVMGIQRIRDVALIRHAYVRPCMQGHGIGGKLLKHLEQLETPRPLLVGTWRAASWAIAFYERHGFRLVSPPDRKNELLRTYWQIGRRQVEESVVLAKRRWLTANHTRGHSPSTVTAPHKS